MEIYWDKQSDYPLSSTVCALLEKALKTGVKIEKWPDNCEVSLSLVNKDEIRGLNKKYRGKSAATDVLSFPVPYSDTETCASIPLGDIVICPQIAKEQALEYGHSFEREMAFLAVHGLLHLLGYDHKDPEDEEEMCTAQDEILESAGIFR